MSISFYYFFPFNFFSLSFLQRSKLFLNDTLLRKFGFFFSCLSFERTKPCFLFPEILLMRRLVFHPARGHPLWLSFEQVDLEHELTIDRVDVVERDHRLEEVAVVVLHVLSNSYRIAILVLLHIKKIRIDLCYCVTLSLLENQSCNFNPSFWYHWPPQNIIKLALAV